MRRCGSDTLVRQPREKEIVQAARRDAAITASAQNAELVRAMVKPMLDPTKKSADGQTIYLKEKITVEAVVTPMKGYGFNLVELYLVDKDGSRKAIIGATEAAAQNVEAEGAFL